MLSTAVEVSCSLTQVTMFHEHAPVDTNTFDLNRVPSGSLEGSQESLLEEEIGGQCKMMEKWVICANVYHIYGTCKQSHRDSLGIALCLLMYSYM